MYNFKKRTEIHGDMVSIYNKVSLPMSSLFRACLQLIMESPSSLTDLSYLTSNGNAVLSEQHFVASCIIVYSGLTVEELMMDI